MDLKSFTMSKIEKAKAFFLQMLPPSPHFLQTPIAFQQETLKWAGDWLWKNEATLEQLLQARQTTESLKRALLEARLAVLKPNSTFWRELETKMATLEPQKGAVKNVVGVNAEIEAQGNVTVGDIGTTPANGLQPKNIVEGKIKAGGMVQIGDQVTTHYHYTVPQEAPASPPSKPQKHQLQQWLAKEKTEAVINGLLTIFEKGSETEYNMILLLSGRFHRIKKQVDKGIVKGSDADITLNQIHDALTHLIDAL
ncbi:MAG: hypothetical protein RLZZ628_3918 [Bacteroidota bacterium]|jgi:hypothetical protein